MVIQDDKDNLFYLPSNDGTCQYYYCHYLDQDYKIQPTATRNKVKEWIVFDDYEVGEFKPYIVHLETYHRYWNMNYPKFMN